MLNFYSRPRCSTNLCFRDFCGMHDKRGQSVLQVARSKSYGQSQSVVLQKNAVLQKTSLQLFILSVFTPTYI